ncbi:PrsW family glutamic-type intramembrane protease [uncultured Solobacterium sp.]|uniref:PrsW family intramembrane metalloprotease n=1 Tax=uncultured Solobacterium sp. TaxID=747375 RepID=UPI0028F09CB7|nr:PrsW family glutamic-type intramembrane protease [uncultured Solobacterium sp.]
MYNQYSQLSLEQTLFYLAIAIFPAIFFMIYIYRNDDKEKEPPLLLLKCIIGGLLSVPIAIILEMIAEAVVIYLLENVVSATRVNYGVLTAIFVGLIEEGAKFFFLYIFTWKDKEFNYRFDGIVYAVFVSLGFAALENVFYVFNYGTGVALQRALLTIPGHMSFAVYMGLYYGHAKVSEAVNNPDAKALNLKAAYAFAVLLHTIFDATLMVESDIGLIIFFIFVIILDIVVYRTIRFESKNDIPIVPPTEEDIYAETQLSRPSPIVEMTDNVSEREKM